MNRSVLLASRRVPRSSARLPSTTILRSQFHSSGSSGNSRFSFRSSSATFWVSAAGTCVFFQVYENWNLNYNLTLTEGRDESEDDGKPWYRRYPTLNLHRIRSYTSATFQRQTEDDPDDDENNPEKKKPEKDNKTLFYGQCLQRQLYQPKVPYPAWDFNWDGKMLDDFSTLEVLSTAEGLQKSHTTGTTRHILLIRHGQYEEKYYDDRKRVLTPLGRRQAMLTGKRIANLIEHIGADKFNAIYTSDLLRAKQTAWIIAKQLPTNNNNNNNTTTIPIQTPDPDLNEGLPAPIVPPRPDLPGIEDEIDENKHRMEHAFRKYIFRADPPLELKQALQQVAHLQQQPLQQEEDEIAISTSGTIWPKSTTTKTTTTSQHQRTPTPTPTRLPQPEHTFDIIVCHGNMIRYFACRALQLPPEAWLRLSVFNCSITYLMIKPNGYVSCRMLGDIGHLGYKETTFSGAHGFVWS